MNDAWFTEWFEQLQEGEDVTLHYSNEEVQPISREYLNWQLNIVLQQYFKLGGKYIRS